MITTQENSTPKLRFTYSVNGSNSINKIQILAQEMEALRRSQNDTIDLLTNWLEALTQKDQSVKEILPQYNNSQETSVNLANKDLEVQELNEKNKLDGSYQLKIKTIETKTTASILDAELNYEQNYKLAVSNIEKIASQHDVELASAIKDKEIYAEFGASYAAQTPKPA